MPEIDIPYKFEDADLIFIETKTNTPGFTYQQWGDLDFQSIRVKIRDYYRLKQKGKCAYCHENISMVNPANAHIEHIVPKSLHIDFMFTPKNLCIVCADCNSIKLNQEVTGEIEDTLKNGKKVKLYPRSSDAFKIVHPHFDIYSEHIRRTGGGYYINLTRKGHFTIGVCNLNRRVQQLGWEEVFINEPEILEIMTKILSEQDSGKRWQSIYNLRDKLNGV